jgi:rod shape-determining protein MreD
MQRQRTNTFLILLAVPVLALLVMLQATVGAHVALFGIKPNLVLLTVLLWTLLRGRREALIIAFTGGFWLDFLSLATLGISSLALILSSFVTGIGRRAVQPTQVLVPVGVGILGSLVYAAVYWVGQAVGAGSLRTLTSLPDYWGIQPLYQVAAMLLLTPWLYGRLSRTPDLGAESGV